MPDSGSARAMRDDVTRFCPPYAVAAPSIVREDGRQRRLVRNNLWQCASNLRDVRRMRVLPAPALVVQREVNDEARSDRLRKRGHSCRDRWGGDGECTVLSPLRPWSKLLLASLYPPKPRLGSPGGRSAHYSVFRSEQSGSNRRW